MNALQHLIEKLRAIETRAAYLEAVAYADPSHHRRNNKLRAVRNLEAQAERIRSILERMGVNPDSTK